MKNLVKLLNVPQSFLILFVFTALPACTVNNYYGYNSPEKPISSKPFAEKPISISHKNSPSPEFPDNRTENNPDCPGTWLGHEFNHAYLRNDGIGKQHVCDYDGSVTTEECKEDQAMLTAGPHGVWCQKYQNGKEILLSLRRTR